MTDPLYHADPSTDAAVIHAALLHTLRYVQDEKPSNYALAQHVITASLVLPQQCKGGYLKGVCAFFCDDTGEHYKEWKAFTTKLLAQVLKAQTIVQHAAMLLEDWQIEAPDVKQLGMFAQERRVPDMTEIYD